MAAADTSNERPVKTIETRLFSKHDNFTTRRKYIYTYTRKSVVLVRDGVGGTRPAGVRVCIVGGGHDFGRK